VNPDVRVGGKLLLPNDEEVSYILAFASDAHRIGSSKIRARPYTLAENPRLLLEIKVQSKSSYFRVSELRKMQRCTVTETDPATKVTHLYEGVGLEQLIPTLSEGEGIQIEFGSRHAVMRF